MRTFADFVSLLFFFPIPYVYDIYAGIRLCYIVCDIIQNNTYKVNIYICVYTYNVLYVVIGYSCGDKRGQEHCSNRKMQTMQMKSFVRLFARPLAGCGRLVKRE